MTWYCVENGETLERWFLKAENEQGAIEQLCGIIGSAVVMDVYEDLRVFRMN